MSQVHRFRDSVAIYVGDGSTRYMSARTARKMAAALLAAARSVDREPFHLSRGLTVKIEGVSAEPLGGLDRGEDGRTTPAARRALMVRDR